MLDSACVNGADDDESPRDSCTDSDGGLVYTAPRGYLTGYDAGTAYGGAGTAWEDVCVSGQLKEFYCGTQTQSYDPLYVLYTCPSGTTCKTSGQSKGSCA